MVNATHLRLWVRPHGHIEELFVEERHTPLHAPGREALVGSEAVVIVQLRELADGLLVESLCVGCFVEVKVAAKNLVRSFAAQHHLNAHRLDDTCQQVHRRRGTDGGHVVGLDEVNHVANGIQSFLNGVVYFVVNGSDVLGHESRLLQVGSALQAHREAVQARPVGTCLRVVLYSVLAELLGNSRDDRGVQSAREQHAVRHVAHQLPLHSRRQRIMYFRNRSRIVLHSIIIEPIALIIPFNF